jgi:hypothetical protein
MLVEVPPPPPILNICPFFVVKPRSPIFALDYFINVLTKVCMFVKWLIFSCPASNQMNENKELFNICFNFF